MNNSLVRKTLQLCSLLVLLLVTPLLWPIFLFKFAGNDEPEHMVEGHTFTIEPILTIGTTECVTWPDNWTTLTADGGVAAQFEHTILITRTGL
ncbi:hypothetical protein F2Q70_00041752 [Brassica cretica]|uniref:Peptidase M24 domain-containing protein n=1 Tax=Brassica cretica TaxID=69181 RepID=A0A8S9RFU9_BRACR|nr:hypothetical protein F2Q70_00041752 [Brassica cretica]KAF3571482.1 hypothetical protein F2Q69_00063433 [Brassica cretica]